MILRDRGPRKKRQINLIKVTAQNSLSIRPFTSSEPLPRNPQFNYYLETTINKKPVAQINDRFHLKLFGFLSLTALRRSLPQTIVSRIEQTVANDASDVSAPSLRRESPTNTSVISTHLSNKTTGPHRTCVTYNGDRPTPSVFPAKGRKEQPAV